MTKNQYSGPLKVIQPSKKQKDQRELAWKLKIVMGTRANIFPREKSLPPEVRVNLLGVYKELEKTEHLLRKALRNIK